MVGGVSGLTGAGAMQLVLDGRAVNPEIRPLLDADDELAIEDEDEFAALDCTAIDDAGLFPPFPPPPQEARKIKLVINRISFTHVFMAIISWN